MKHVLDEFRSRGIRTLDLMVNRHAAAFKLYAKLGFQQPEGFVLMTKWL